MKCVYCLDFANGRRYVGSTKNLKKRLEGHRWPGHNKKSNPELKEAILEGNYQVVILEQLPDSATKKELVAREQHYYDLWFDSGILYNKFKGAAGGGTYKGRKHTEESIAKMSAIKKGIKKTEEHKAKISATKRGPVWDHADEIKAQRAAGIAYYKIAERYNSHPDTIKKICLLEN